MKILLRNFRGKIYVWKDAKYEKKGFTVDGATIQETNIVSIMNDTRKHYVKCSHCGEIFRKGSKKWEKHIVPITDTHKCFACRYLRPSRGNVQSVKYSLLPNGRYAATQKSEVDLLCTYGYPSRDINSESARNHCELNRCTDATQVEIEDVFTTNPGVFDEMITIDKVIENGYKDAYESCGNTFYKLKAKNNIVAVVNEMNIVDKFSVTYKNTTWEVYYSKTYNKCYTPFYEYRVEGNVYKEWNPNSYDLPTSTKENIIKKIASLYA